MLPFIFMSALKHQRKLHKVNVLDYILLVLQGLGAICVVATVVVRLTPSPKDDAKVMPVVMFIYKMLKWLPTIGLNPNTQELEKLVSSQSSKPSPKKSK